MSTKTQTQSVFAKLYAINVSDKIEVKNKLSYVSWANAWAMLKSEYPDAQRKVYESDHTGLNYFTDGKTAYVKVGIIVEGVEHIDYLPVMDHRNQAIPLERITAFDVNKTIQRSTAKAIAMHGLGLALWTGEDLPDEGKTGVSLTTQPQPQQTALPQLKNKSPEWEAVVKYIEANKNLGVDMIIAQVKRKYTVSDKAIEAITALINA